MSDDSGFAPDYIALASEIVSAFVANNSVPVAELPGLIASVHATLSGLDNPTAEPAALTPAVSIKRSITPDYPMVAPNYAAARSELARTMGLGQQRRKRRTGTED